METRLTYRMIKGLHISINFKCFGFPADVAYTYILFVSQCLSFLSHNVTIPNNIWNIGTCLILRLQYRDCRSKLSITCVTVDGLLKSLVADRIASHVGSTASICLIIFAMHEVMPYTIIMGQNEQVNSSFLHIYIPSM